MSNPQRIRHHYQPRINELRDNYDVVDWASAEAQQTRFAVLLDSVRLEGRRLLDVGCGMGDLWIFLKTREVSVEYCGVDLLAEMTASAAIQSPEARFVCGDIFDPEDKTLDGERFDVVFCSGTLNLDLGNNTEFLPKALERMLGLAREHMVVNLLHARCEKKYPHCAYYDPQIVLKILKPLACGVRLIDDYLHNDFTLVCSPSGD